MPTSIRLKKETEHRLNTLAQTTGRSKAFYIREAIENHIEDMEDFFLAEKRLDDLKIGKSRTYSLSEVEEELGLGN